MFNHSPGGFTWPTTSSTVSILKVPSKSGLLEKMPCVTVAIQNQIVSSGNGLWQYQLQRNVRYYFFSLLNFYQVICSCLSWCICIKIYIIEQYQQKSQFKLKIIFGIKFQFKWKSVFRKKNLSERECGAVELYVRKPLLFCFTTLIV